MVNHAHYIRVLFVLQSHFEQCFGALDLHLAGLALTVQTVEIVFVDFRYIDRDIQGSNDARVPKNKTKRTR